VCPSGVNDVADVPAQMSIDARGVSGCRMSLANTVDVRRAACERVQATKMKKLSKIEQSFRTLIKKQLSLVNGQLGAEYLVIFPNINVTSNWL